ncbi:ATP-dependent sacrificial sulfur transferase LarE [Kineosporia sp. J2-2]|uniref:ATP-dependent sacrificial sulfur transferase LarE n=1 Tax=Kineosporia corallincola TaxID=2835133 RepID=A0ABS5TQ85_9ACTN|nr:ATP-dependent sacrificial sulfur transferase LarE [Kineosporia corallincola]MBT0772988.1 ATP-dependent sacrificial sulfur transferase LarE [Kineosporia corallincola]
MTDPWTQEKSQAVAQTLAGITRLGVAFSGGVDSSVLLALATEHLGHDQVLAIIGVSPSLAETDRAAAHTVALHIGVKLLELPTHEGQRPQYQANGPDRCFHCKDELFTRITDDLVHTHHLDAVAYGENADDTRRPDRPGSRAAHRHRVLHPLADAGLTKTDVRRIARAYALPSAGKPASPCLASRIPHFQDVTPDKLRQIEQAEKAIREMGFPDLRVRHHGEIARIELPLEDLPRALTEPRRATIHAAVLAAGFRYATIDLAGLQSGAFTLSLVPVSHA